MEYEKFMSGYPGQEVQLLWVIAICGIAFAILNGFVNVFRWRRGYLIMLLASASLLSCAMAATGLVWRHVRQAQTLEQHIGNKSDCAITMSTIHLINNYLSINLPIHENNLQDWCKQPKYLGRDQKCSKKFMVLRWEYQDELRSLNPVCCLVAKHFYLYPHMCLAYWSTLLLMALQINCLLNLGLCDQEDNLSQTSRLITWADIFGKCSVLLIVLGFGLYFYFRKASHIAFESKADIQRSFESPQTVAIEGYPKVPDSILATTNIEKRFNSELPNFSVCFPYSETFLYFPEGEVLNCGNPILNSNCALRVSIGVNDAKIVLKQPKQHGYFQSFQDLTTARAFFPFCGATQVKDTLLLVGTASNVANALRSLLICPDRIYSTQKVLVFADTVQMLTQRLTNGVTDQENPR